MRAVVETNAGEQWAGSQHRQAISALAGLLLLALLALLAVCGWALQQHDQKRLRVISLPAYPLALHDDNASLARGRYLYDTRGCAGCHGQQGEGRLFIDDLLTGQRVASPNISPGPGNVVAGYQPADWERVLRHGVKPNGQPVLLMPSDDYSRLSDDDLASLVQYLRQLPPVPGRAAVLELPTSLRLRHGLGQWQDAAEKIDHARPPEPAEPEALSVGYGRYVAQACTRCHGAQLTGGRDDTSQPWAPSLAPDLPTATGSGNRSGMSAYADPALFRRLMRTGTRPDHSAVSRSMPFESLSQMSDLELDALQLYLRSLPASATALP